MIDTKKRIIATAISLYNEYGYGVITMRDIADKMQLDRRNVTYHYNKEELLAAIAEQMWAELEACRAQKRDFPSFENLDKEVTLYSDLQSSYAFIFMDLHVIRHPLIHEKFKDFTNTLIADSQQAVAFAINQGNMKPESVPGTYNTICTAVWTITMSRLQLNALRGIHRHDEVRKLIWSLIVPYFTDKGIAAFKSFFGEELYQNLGIPFDVRLNTVMF